MFLEDGCKMIELRELQLCQLDIALEIKRICEKYDIQYFLIGGTLLGAVRHGGFIPWDDDIDIGFMRPDYERFLKACSTDLGSQFFLQTWDTDKYYCNSFGKVMLNGTTHKEVTAGNAQAKMMIFADVFPYDVKLSNTVLAKTQFHCGNISRKLMQYKLGYNMSLKSPHKNLHRIFKLISKLFSVRFLKKVITYTAEVGWKDKKAQNAINLNGAYRDREVFALDGFSVEKINFEGYEFNAPICWREYLTNIYGDYTIFPPEDERGDRHAAIKIDIGTHKIRNNAVRESVIRR